MKTSIFFLLALCSSFICFSQQSVFTSVSLQSIQGRETFRFTMPREVNVRHYRIEASNDSLHFETISTVPSKGGSMLPVSYDYDVQAYPYTYYRVGMVQMNGQLPYSDIVTNKTDTKIKEYREAIPATGQSGDWLTKSARH